MPKRKNEFADNATAPVKKARATEESKLNYYICPCMRPGGEREHTRTNADWRRMSSPWARVAEEGQTIGGVGSNLANAVTLPTTVSLFQSPAISLFASPCLRSCSPRLSLSVPLLLYPPDITQNQCARLLPRSTVVSKRRSHGIADTGLLTQDASSIHGAAEGCN